MKVYQMLPTLAYGDAIGNDVVALGDALEESGYETAIYAKNIDKRMLKNKLVKHYSEYVDAEDIIILYHLSIGDTMNDELRGFTARKFFIYHNITPAEFFKPYNPAAEKMCEEGLESIKSLRDVPEMVFADSAFNKKDLISYGYKCPIEVLPILIAFDDYKKMPAEGVLKKYQNDGYTNIMFAGRVAPNKKQEDVITAFYYYNTYINPKSRLFIVGSYNENDLYYRKLKAYKEELELENVIMTGHIPFNEILSYYRLADVFLCLSEHEGFCVPLVEAMYFKKPVIAYDSTAVGETLGGSGMLLKEKDPRIVAEAINQVVSNEEIRSAIIENEEERLAFFDNDLIKDYFIKKLKAYIKNERNADGIVIEGNEEEEEIAQEKELKRVIASIFNGILGRKPSKKELENYYLEIIKADTETYKNIISNMYNSDEHKNRGLNIEEYIQSLYVAVLLRTPEEADVIRWKKRIMATGMNRKRVLEKILASEEFMEVEKRLEYLKTIVGENHIKEYIKNLYQNALDRKLSEKEINNWYDSVMNKKIKIEEIVFEILNSKEYKNRRMVEDLYKLLLGRRPESSEIKAALDQLNNDFITEEDVSRSIIASAEFKEKTSEISRVLEYISKPQSLE